MGTLNPTHSLTHAVESKSNGSCNRRVKEISLLYNNSRRYFTLETDGKRGAAHDGDRWKRPGPVRPDSEWDTDVPSWQWLPA